MPFDAENFKPKIVPQGGHPRTLYEVLIPEFTILHDLIDKQQKELDLINAIVKEILKCQETMVNIVEQLVKERNNAETAINTDSGNKTAH